MEARLQNCIYEALAGRIPTEDEWAKVKVVDTDALYAEALALTNEHCWVQYIPTTKMKVLEALDHYDVGDEFISRYYELLKAVRQNGG